MEKKLSVWTLKSDKGGVSRTMECYELLDSGYGILINTDWNDSLPNMETKIPLTDTGIVMLHRLLGDVIKSRNIKETL